MPAPKKTADEVAAHSRNPDAAFAAVVGSTRGAYTEKDRELDAFLLLHRDHHGGRFFFRYRAEEPGQPYSLTCIVCDVGMFAESAAWNAAMDRVRVEAEGFGPPSRRRGRRTRQQERRHV